MALMMEAVSTTTASVSIHQTTRRNIPEDSQLLTQQTYYYIYQGKYVIKKVKPVGGQRHGFKACSSFEIEFQVALNRPAFTSRAAGAVGCNSITRSR
jgi:hypothetical protein